MTWGFATPGLALAVALAVALALRIDLLAISELPAHLHPNTYTSQRRQFVLFSSLFQQIIVIFLAHSPLPVLHDPSTTPTQQAFHSQCRELLLQVAPDALEARVCLAATPELLLPARAMAVPKATARHRDMEVLRAVLKDMEPLKEPLKATATPELLLSDRPTCRDITKSLLLLPAAEAALDQCLCELRR